MLGLYSSSTNRLIGYHSSISGLIKSSLLPILLPSSSPNRLDPPSTCSARSRVKDQKLDPLVVVADDENINQSNSPQSQSPILIHQPSNQLSSTSFSNQIPSNRNKLSSIEMISKQYVHQSIRLARDALSEQDKGSFSDASYTLDCYLASMEYLLSAIPNPHYFVKALSEKSPMVRIKLEQLSTQLEELKIKLIDELEEEDVHQGLEAKIIETQSYDRVSIKAEGGNGSWINWSIVKNILPTSLTKADRLGEDLSQKYLTKRNSNKFLLSSPEGIDFDEDELEEEGSVELVELVRHCHCGRRVKMKLPHWINNNNYNNEDYRRERTESINRGDQMRDERSQTGWPEAIFSFLITIVLMIKQSPLPYWLKLIITSIFSGLIYIEAKLELRRLIWRGFVGSIDRLKKLDHEFGLNQMIADFISWLINRSFIFLCAITKLGQQNNMSFNDQAEEISKSSSKRRVSGDDGFEDVKSLNNKSWISGLTPSFSSISMINNKNSSSSSLKSASNDQYNNSQQAYSQTLKRKNVKKIDELRRRSLYSKESRRGIKVDEHEVDEDDDYEERTINKKNKSLKKSIFENKKVLKRPPVNESSKFNFNNNFEGGGSSSSQIRKKNVSFD
ncbi:hypothetical protein BY996DRAFT_6417599 [Phakopsora pachyrhizi]|nr:hypothetical protein BY996DRAFT_6417599 [Phakopsora pachyrhizi]